MIVTLFVMVAASSAPYSPAKITSAEKKSFIEFAMALPREGEGFTEEAGKLAAPHIGVFLALGTKDVNDFLEVHLTYLIGPILEQKDARIFCLHNYSKIVHPSFKIIIGIYLFEKKHASTEVVSYLRQALETEKGKELFEDLLGSGVDDFKARLNSDK